MFPNKRCLKLHGKIDKITVINIFAKSTPEFTMFLTVKTRRLSIECPGNCPTSESMGFCSCPESWWINLHHDSPHQKPQKCRRMSSSTCFAFGNPLFWPACHRFAQDNGKQIMDMYCDQDILILMVNAPFVVRFILAFATTFMAKRQSLAYRSAEELIQLHAIEILAQDE